MTLTELASKQVLRPYELAQLGDKVTIFTADRDNTEFKRYGSKVKIVHLPRQDDEDWQVTKARVQFAVKEECEKYPSHFYTGIHRESDWSRTYLWDMGWHICNRTGDYAVVKETCETCLYQNSCSMRGDMVTWCAEFSTL